MLPTKSLQDYVIEKGMLQNTNQNDVLQDAHETRLAKHLTALMIYLQLFPGQNLERNDVLSLSKLHAKK